MSETEAEWAARVNERAERIIRSPGAEAYWRERIAGEMSVERERLIDTLEPRAWSPGVYRAFLNSFDGWLDAAAFVRRNKQEG